tara:strand:- start:2042 stop:2749 length:708 start_codon:yes stop_codon:yes gene_type:complete
LRNLLISGASRGIGKAIALRALEKGHCISLGIRNPDAIKETKLYPKISNKANIYIHKYDSLIKNSAEEWVENTVKVFGKIDTVIHCAGIFKRTRLNFESGNYDELDELWKTNVMGPWLLTRAAWKHLERAKNGRIIVLVSMSGKRSKDKLAGYVTSKFALMGLCHTIRNEGWSKGIRITAICPGWVNTDMSKEINIINKNEMTQPDDIAKICSNLLELPNSAIPFEIALNCNLEY